MVKKSFSSIYVSAIILASMLGACRNSGTSKAEITVFCCSGLTEVITEMSDSFKVKNSVEIHLNFASSGTLARQLKNGAPADLYLSASDDWMEFSINNGLLDTATVTTFLKNRLAWVAPQSAFEGSAFTIDSIKSTQKIAIGDSAHVPAGSYAREYLIKTGKWSSVESQLIPCRDAKNTLFMVEHGEVEFGIVYYSDAIRSKKVQILEIIPDSLHTSVNLSVAMVKNSTKAADFFAFLINDSNNVYYKKYGFNPINE